MLSVLFNNVLFLLENPLQREKKIISLESSKAHPILFYLNLSFFSQIYRVPQKNGFSELLGLAMIMGACLNSLCNHVLVRGSREGIV